MIFFFFLCVILNGEKKCLILCPSMRHKTQVVKLVGGERESRGWGGMWSCQSVSQWEGGLCRAQSSNWTPSGPPSFTSLPFCWLWLAAVHEMPHQLKVCCELALTILWLRGDLPYCNLVIRHEGNNSKCQEMWGRINASLLQVAQGDSSYLMYKSVPLPVDLGSRGRGKGGGSGLGGG